MLIAVAAHKSILCARSDYFMALFMNGMKVRLVPYFSCFDLPVSPAMPHRLLKHTNKHTDTRSLSHSLELSLYYLAKCWQESLSNEIIIPNIRRPIFKAMLVYLYTELIEDVISQSMALELLQVADQYRYCFFFFLLL